MQKDSCSIVDEGIIGVLYLLQKESNNHKKHKKRINKEKQIQF